MAEIDTHKENELDRVFKGRLFIKTPVLARLLGVSTRSVQKWVFEGKIEYCDTTPSGRQLLFDRATVEGIILHGIGGRLMGDTVEHASAGEI